MKLPSKQHVHREQLIDLFGLSDRKIKDIPQYLLSLIPQECADSASLRIQYSYDNVDCYIQYQQLETDQEYEFRIKTLMAAEQKKKNQQQAKLEKERKEYERLKRKFGNV